MNYLFITQTNLEFCWPRSDF